MKKILIIDDEQMVMNVLKIILEDSGYQVTSFNDSQAGEKAALENNYDLIIVDVHMPGKNGAEVTRGILEAKPGARILIITAYPTDPLAVMALEAGAVGLVKKPFELDKILGFLKDNFYE